MSAKHFAPKFPAESMDKKSRMLVQLNASQEPLAGTPLNLAAYNGHAAVCELLLDRGADPNAKDRVWHGGGAGLRGSPAERGSCERGQTPLDMGSSVSVGARGD